MRNQFLTTKDIKVTKENLRALIETLVLFVSFVFK